MLSSLFTGGNFLAVLVLILFDFCKSSRYDCLHASGQSLTLLALHALLVFTQEESKLSWRVQCSKETALLEAKRENSKRETAKRGGS